MSRPFTHCIDSGALISKQQAWIRWKLRTSRSRQKSLRQEARVGKQGLQHVDPLPPHDVNATDVC